MLSFSAVTPFKSDLLTYSQPFSAILSTSVDGLCRTSEVRFYGVPQFFNDDYFQPLEDSHLINFPCEHVEVRAYSPDGQCVSLYYVDIVGSLEKALLSVASFATRIEIFPSIIV